jgi:broad specificity polyphosphatase/5'/3'-nucleotidase SurE
MQRGIPAIALSAGGEGGSFDAAFANAAEILVPLLDALEAAQPAGAPLIPGAQGLSINIPGDPDPLGLATTRVDREASATFPISQLASGLYNSTFTPATSSSDNPLSEGAQFLLDRVTFSPIDGNWSADEAVRLDLAARLDGRLGDGTLPKADPLDILLVNDEGVNAPGIDAMRDALLALGFEVTVAAPAADQRAVGTALTLTDFAVTPTAEGFTVAATPSTTVYATLDALLTGADRPDLIISYRPA